MTGQDQKRGRGSDGYPPNRRLSPIARELNSERVPVGEGQHFPRSISGASFAAGDPVKQFASGRVCAVEGCETKLSRYNPSDTCAEHPYTKMVMQVPKIVRIDTKKIRKKAKRKRGSAD